MAASKKRTSKKSTTRRPSVTRAKPRRKAPTSPPPAGEEAVEAAGAAVAESDAEAPAQPGPYLAALQRIAESLVSVEGTMLAVLEHLRSRPSDAPAAPRPPRKPKEAQEPAPAAPPAQEGAPAAPQAPAKAYKAPRPCAGCGKNLDDDDSQPHSAACPVAHPPAKAAPAAPPAPPKQPTVEEVRSAFLSYASRLGRDAAIALLGRFSAAKVADLPAERFSEFLTALKEG